MNCIPWSRLIKLELRCLEQLKGLPSPMGMLRHLKLQDCSQLVDLSLISSCVALQHLQFRHCNELVDISPLSTLMVLRNTLTSCIASG